jgi:transcriptional regulator with XRE-family HTH domain
VVVKRQASNDSVMDPCQLLGANVRRLRQERGLSQEELGFRIGIHYTYLGSVERGERNVALRNIVRIARALGVPVAELFEGIDPAQMDDVSGPG